jgi:hypothetical protein
MNHNPWQPPAQNAAGCRILLEFFQANTSQVVCQRLTASYSHANCATITDGFKCLVGGQYFTNNFNTATQNAMEALIEDMTVKAMENAGLVNQRNNGRVDIRVHVIHAETIIPVNTDGNTPCYEELKHLPFDLQQMQAMQDAEWTVVSFVVPLTGGLLPVRVYHGMNPQGGSLDQENEGDHAENDTTGTYFLIYPSSYLMLPITVPKAGNLCMWTDGSPVMHFHIFYRERGDGEANGAVPALPFFGSQHYFDNALSRFVILEKTWPKMSGPTIKDDGLDKYRTQVSLDMANQSY